MTARLGYIRTSHCMSSHVEHATAARSESSPTPKARKMSQRSLFIPSTTLLIEPSFPRSALPLPHTLTNVIT